MDITVCIPVGPFKANAQWLWAALDSVEQQTLKPAEVLIINDGGNIREINYRLEGRSFNSCIWSTPWRLGVGHAFNFGVALARNECVFMLGSDDTLEPECLQACMEMYKASGEDNCYYHVPVRYMSNGMIQYTPCNAAMVTKGLWKLTGGFPIEATTAPDAALLSIMMVHMPDRILAVNHAGVLYNYRDHEDTDTKQHGAWHASNVIVQTRNLLTSEWRSPEWTQNFI